ncbi:hypothetical protein SAMN05421759_11611 [Roseivivax lentus]|uniref:Uncharacterized protein n=1 Tax=Roseivivax lentus TaxID=633194 RepID=A0A1N7PIG5_9RHOB|nr:hypothetical protein [Roseivivax lentus]SIT10307.1 hypothetical protein SAMN05421759_11611 [Roseivivax lentus]
MGFDFSDWDKPDEWLSDWRKLDKKLSEYSELSSVTNMPIGSYPDFERYIVTSIKVAQAFRRSTKAVVDQAFLVSKNIDKILEEMSKYKTKTTEYHRTSGFQDRLTEFRNQEAACIAHFYRFRSIVSDTLAARVDNYVKKNQLYEIELSGKSFADALRSFLSQAGGYLFSDLRHINPKPGHAKELLEAQLGVGQLILEMAEWFDYYMMSMNNITTTLEHSLSLISNELIELDPDLS